ncbi:MAG: hypothetical protein KJO38_09585 [Gammaproteobacteria bacterium]|nr:hypothetical protein [Gammaproteobacteria bacterium]
MKNVMPSGSNATRAGSVHQADSAGALGRVQHFLSAVLTACSWLSNCVAWQMRKLQLIG